VTEIEPPYYAVIFSRKLSGNTEGYAEMSSTMQTLAEKQPGYLGLDAIRNEEQQGISISYWDSLEAIQSWRNNVQHQQAMNQGTALWYQNYQVKIARVERAYAFDSGDKE